jgi:hypothetical protein
VPSIARWVRMGASWNEPDATRPARITDLTPDFLSCHAISLNCTAVGDDGASGVAAYADVRRSTSPIDSTNFSSATPANPQPVPVCPGTLQAFSVSGLGLGTTYYFAIKIADESGNVSLISNVASATTLDDCGIGERAERAREGASTAGARGAEGAPATSPSGATPSGAAGGGSPLVIEAAPQAGSLEVTIRAVADASQEGDAIAGAGGVLQQTRDDAGHWRTAGQYDPPPGERFALLAPDRPKRWVFLQSLTVKGVLPQVSGSGSGWVMNGAQHSRDGDVLDALAARGAVPALSAGDTLRLHYAAADSAAAAPAWLVVFEWPGTGTTRAHLGRRPDAGTGLPIAFALHQNLPNPFAATTTIGFALPVASRVRLEVYDLLGRKVRTLANASYPPGEHQVLWNRRTASGALAAPGLYFYRMDAGQYREKRRMVILP